VRDFADSLSELRDIWHFAGGAKLKASDSPFSRPYGAPTAVALERALSAPTLQ